MTKNELNEIRGIAEDYIAGDEIDEFLERVTKATTTTAKADDSPVYMPNGFKYLDGAIKSKDYRIADEKGNVFTWVPRRILRNGTLVKGFFVSTYEISKGDDGAPRSVEGETPWVEIDWLEAMEQAMKFGGRLLEDSEWDAICEECAEIVGDYKVYKNSTEIGNFWNSVGSTESLEKTGKHVICGISNLAGNCWTWIHKLTNDMLAVIRGGSFDRNSSLYRRGPYDRNSPLYRRDSFESSSGNSCSMASCHKVDPNFGYYNIGFRVVLFK